MITNRINNYSISLSCKNSPRLHSSFRGRSLFRFQSILFEINLKSQKRKKSKHGLVLISQNIRHIWN